MNKYPPLYKRTATGAIQMWWMEQDGPRYRTHSGQMNGQVVVTEWTTAKPKNVGRANATSAAQQASAEVESAYTLKRKKGYRDTPDAAETSDRFQCMLAEHWKQKPKESDASYARRMAKLFDGNGNALNQLYMQPKLDGIRCIATKAGLFSREGNPLVAAPHVFEALQPFFDRYPNFILDGELYNHELKDDFNTIVSIVKKLKPTTEDLERSREMAQYWIYDGLIDDRGACFGQRFVEEIAPRIYEAPCLVIVPTYPVATKEDIDGMYESFLEEGYEGGMVRQDTHYENKRTYALLKRKEMMDAEFTLLRLEEGDGNAAGMAKRAYLELEDGGEVKADVCGTREELRALYRRRDEMVGKKTTIHFQNRTPDGSLRFPKLKVGHQEWW